MNAAALLLTALASTGQITTISVVKSDAAPFAGAYVWISPGLDFRNDVIQLGPTDANGQVATDCFNDLKRAYVKATPGKDRNGLEQSAIQVFSRGIDYPPRSIDIDLDPQAISRTSQPATLADGDKEYWVQGIGPDGQPYYERHIKRSVDFTSARAVIPGYHWELAYVKKWYDPQRQMHASQPFYVLVPNASACRPCATCP